VLDDAVFADGVGKLECGSPVERDIYCPIPTLGSITAENGEPLRVACGIAHAEGRAARDVEGASGVPSNSRLLRIAFGLCESLIRRLEVSPIAGREFGHVDELRRSRERLGQEIAEPGLVQCHTPFAHEVEVVVRLGVENPRSGRAV
jgi:hypothetical protein